MFLGGIRSTALTCGRMTGVVRPGRSQGVLGASDVPGQVGGLTVYGRLLCKALTTQNTFSRGNITDVCPPLLTLHQASASNSGSQPF